MGETCRHGDEWEYEEAFDETRLGERCCMACRAEKAEALVDQMKRSRCPIDKPDEYEAYKAGYAYGVEHGYDPHVEAKGLDVYPESQDKRIVWQRGYDDCEANRRLGHDVVELLRLELYWVDAEGAAIIKVTDNPGHLYDELLRTRQYRDELHVEVRSLRTALAERGK